MRTTAIELGLGCAVCANPLSGAAIKSHGIPNSMSLAWYLGRAIHIAKRLKRSYVDAIVSHVHTQTTTPGGIALILITT